MVDLVIKTNQVFIKLVEFLGGVLNQLDCLLSDPQFFGFLEFASEFFAYLVKHVDQPT